MDHTDYVIKTHPNVSGDLDYQWTGNWMSTTMEIFMYLFVCSYLWQLRNRCMEEMRNLACSSSHGMLKNSDMEFIISVVGKNH